MFIDEKMRFTEFTAESIPIWEKIFGECFINDGPGGDLYIDYFQLKRIVDQKLFGKIKPEIKWGSMLINEVNDFDYLNTVFTEAIIEAGLQTEAIILMNEWF